MICEIWYRRGAQITDFGTINFPESAGSRTDQFTVQDFGQTYDFATGASTHASTPFLKPVIRTPPNCTGPKNFGGPCRTLTFGKVTCGSLNFLRVRQFPFLSMSVSCAGQVGMGSSWKSGHLVDPFKSIV